MIASLRIIDLTITCLTLWGHFRVIQLNKIVWWATLMTGLSVSVIDRKGGILCSNKDAFEKKLALIHFTK